MPTALCEITGESRPGGRTIGEARSLAEAFSRITARRGEAIAVRSSNSTLSYAELDRQAKTLAHALATRGVSRGALVAIYLPRGVDMVIAMLGVCKAGGAYLPLDPSFPTSRVLETLADAQPVVLITDTSLQTQLGDTSISTLLVHDALAEPSVSAIDIIAELDDLAYVIYTSGSTGRPKGVMVSQRNVLRLLSQTAHWFHFDERDVWTMFHSFAFDFSVWEIWGALLTGGTLVIVPYETSRSPEACYDLLARERVTVLNQTPTAFGLLSRAVEARELPLALRYVIFGGEALNLRSLRSWVERFGDSHPQLINMYGITETTVHVTYRRILAADVEHETDSLIGQPIPDLQLHLLDEAQQPVALGDVGEMYIGGGGVALGYLRRPDLTAGRFLPDAGTAGGRLYRSGDLARRRADGELVYLGRADRQVKINGFRVEPGEIEALLAEYPGVQQVCVTPLDGAEGAHFLAAYFVATAPLDRNALAAALAELLPAHMRPTFYVQLSTLPLTVNGKVDRDALPRPDVLQGNTFAADAMPLSQKIASLWAGILQEDTVSENDNFFDAGGTSLQLLALRTALQQRLGREISVLWLFEHTTPEALARKLSQDTNATQSKPAPAQTAADRQRQSFARARALRSLPS